MRHFIDYIDITFNIWKLTVNKQVYISLMYVQICNQFQNVILKRVVLLKFQICIFTIMFGFVIYIHTTSIINQKQ